MRKPASQHSFRRRLSMEHLEARHVLAPTPIVNDANTLLMLRFDGNTNGEAGEIPTSQTGATFTTGVVSQALHTASPGNINFSLTNNILSTSGTVEFWFSPDWNGNLNQNHMFFEAGNNFNRGMLLGIDGANNLRFIQWGDDPGTAAVENNVERGCGTSGSTLAAGSWNHFAATWDSAQRSMALYLNGKSVCTATNGVVISSFSGTTFSIGAEVNGASPALASFDELRISDRQRTAGEITASYYAGLGENRVVAPVGVAVDGNQRTIVVESGVNRVVVYDNAGTKVGQFGGSGTTGGLFNNPSDVAIDSANNIFVVDRGNNRVQKFADNGSFLQEFGNSGGVTLTSPRGIAYDLQGSRIYVADSANHRVVRYLANGALDTTFGVGGFIGQTGTVLRDHSGFDRPSDIAIHPLTGEIYVSDYGNARVEVYSATGSYLRSYLSIYRANNLAFDPQGNLYITGDDPNEGYTYADGRVRLLRWGDELLTAHYTGGLDDIGNTPQGIAIRGNDIVFADMANGRIVATNRELDKPIYDLEVDARGTEVTFRWKTLLPSPSRVRYGGSSQLPNVFGSDLLKTTHEVTLTGLTSDTRLFYGVSLTSRFDGTVQYSKSDVINTGVPRGQTQFLRVKALGLIYTDGQGGAGYTRLADSLIAEMRLRFHRIAEFYYHNSGFKLWPDIQVVEVNRDITTASVSLFGAMSSDAAALGFTTADDFDAAWAVSTLADGNFGGGGSLLGRSVAMAQWVTQSDFVAIHEMNHSFDSMYAAVGLSKYEFNHGVWAVPGGLGLDTTINGQILRNFQPANFTATLAPYRKVMTALDADSDGVPDASPSGLQNPLPVIESTIGTSTASADSDGDGLSDLQEATYFADHGLNPLSGDSDGDGIPDATDRNPGYPINDRIVRGTPQVDGIINASEGWTTLTNRWGYTNNELVSDNNSLQSQTTTYAAWDDNFLYLALVGPASSTTVYLDGGADNWYMGPDNYRLTLSNSSTSKAVAINVGVPDLFRQVDDDGQFSAFLDTDAKFTKPYQGRPFYNQTNEGPGFPARLVTENDITYQRAGSGNARVWEVAIPWSNKTGLRGFNGKEMALAFEVSGDRLFETDHAALVKLVNSAGEDTAPPTMSNIADQTTNEDTILGPIPFTVSDLDTLSSALTITTTSSQPALVSTANIQVQGTGANRTLTITPTANLSGTATITVNVSDGINTTSDSFLLTVIAVNDAPTITSLPTQSINEDSATNTLSFTVSDPESAPATLLVTATSSNTSLVPPGNILLQGTSAQRSVRVTPAEDLFGTAVITLTVSDGDRSTLTTFSVVVNPVNDAPFIDAMASQSIAEDGSTAVLNFTIGDIDTSLSNLIVTATSNNLGLVPLAAIALSGSGATRGIQVTPSANASGQATITVMVNDGVATTNSSFVLTVAAVNDAPTIGALAPIQLNEDTVNAPIVITLADVDSAVAGLSLTAISSDETLVSSSGLTFEGSGANRTLRITSRANQHGTLQITLTASDGQAVGTRVVQLTLLPVNDVPIRLLLSSTDVYESATGALISPFHVDDPDLDDLHLVTILAPETRFEIVGNELRLKPNVYLPLGTPSPIIFTLRIEDPGNPSFAIEQEVQLTVRPNPFPWRNRRNPLDVDDDGFITPLDAQLAITHLNAVGPLELRIGEWPLPHTGHFLDTSGDNFVTPLDVLLIISNLNSNSGEGEGSDHDISDVADEDIFASSTHTWWLVDSLADDLTRRRNRVLRD